MLTRKTELNKIFTYHPPKSGQPERYEKLRSAANKFAKTIMANVPQCQDRDYAITKVREAVMFANAAIAIEESF